VILLALGATALVVVSFRGVDVARVAALLVRAEPAWLLAALLANGTIPLLWAAQWSLFLPRAALRGSAMGFRAMFGVTAVMAMMVNSVPMLVGQATGLHLLATRARVGHATALSVIALDQLAEGMAKLSVLCALAAVTPLPPALRSGLAVLATVVALLLVVVMAAAWSHGRVRLPASERPVLARAASFVTDWVAGLERARQPAVLAGGLAIGLTMKGAEMGGILAVQAALGVELPLWSALAVLAAVSLATIISVSPGNVGVYEGSAYLAYTALGVSPETALGLAVLQHVAYLIPMAGTGWVVVLLAQKRAQAAAIAPADPPLRARS